MVGEYDQNTLCKCMAFSKNKKYYLKNHESKDITLT